MATPQSYTRTRFARLACFLVGWLATSAATWGNAAVAVAADTKLKSAAAASKSKTDASDEFFAKGGIPWLKIEISPSELDQLRRNNRQYVRCTVKEGDKAKPDKTTYVDVGIHLKGAAGSFRDLNDRPALTLNFDKFKKKQFFHDVDKIHLNNSVQDPTYLQELICADLFLAAGVPAARASHARVWLNGRDLGFYGLKEGFDGKSLKRHFDDAQGNLYDGGFCQEIDAQLKKQTGVGPDDRSDLKALIDACREPDVAKRWQRVEQQLDIDKFNSFMALELMTCHWDGYCLNRNNYRMYFDPAGKRWHFFPHGMDQMFGDTNASILNEPGALVASTVMKNPEWRSRYRRRVSELLPLFSPPDKLLARIDAAHARIRPALNDINADFARQHDDQVRGLKERIVARAKNLEQQNAVPEPKPLRFNAQGVAQVGEWKPNDATSPDAKLVSVAPTGEPKCLTIACGPSGRCVASWRSRVILSAGKYKLEGAVRTAGVVPLADPKGAGAGLRISGEKQQSALAGDAKWQKLGYEFVVVDATKEIELVAELRAAKGQVWFDADSLRIVRAAK